MKVKLLSNLLGRYHVPGMVSGDSHVPRFIPARTHSFVQSFNKHLLKAFHMLGTFPDTRDISQMRHDPSPQEGSQSQGGYTNRLSGWMSWMVSWRR